MQGGPFCHHSQGAGWQATAENGQGVDVDENLVIAVLGMEVGRVVVVVEDPDDDPVEAADLRHARSAGWVP